MRAIPLRELTIFGGILLLASGCGGDADDAGPADAETPEPGGTAVVVEAADISTPVPLIPVTLLDGNLASDVMNMELVRGDWEDGRLVYLTADRSPMAIARSYEHVGPDSAALRFHMRSDVRWSDGEPLTADDVVFTYELLRQPELGSSLASYVEMLDSIRAENDSTVTFYYQRQYAEMLSHSAAALLPRHVFEGTPAGEIRTHPSILNPAGTLVVSGPFMISEWRKGESVALRPNPYFTPKPHLNEIAIRVIPDGTTRLVELQTGAADFVPGLMFDQIAPIRADPAIRLEVEESRFYDFIAYNPTGFEPFADPQIRRALGLAIDSERLIEALQMEDFATTAGGPYPPIFAGLYDPERLGPLPYDPDEARRVLEASGWRDTNGDRIREKNGRPFRFTMVTNTGNQRRADASQIIQQQWREVGVDVQLRQLEYNTLMENVIGHDYEAALIGWSVGLTPDFVRLLFTPGELYNMVSYANPRAAELIEKASAQPTAEAALPYWRQAAAQIALDQPYTWLYYFDSVAGVRNRLRGTEVDTYGRYQNTWEWWIPRSQQRGAAAAPAS